MKTHFDRIEGGWRLGALGAVFVALGAIALVRTLLGLVQAAELEWSTELLLLPSGIGILRSRLGWLRFARILVALTFGGTLLLVFLAVAVIRVDVVSVGAFAGSSAPFWRILLTGAVYLFLEGTALVWMTREVKRRLRSVH